MKVSKAEVRRKSGMIAIINQKYRLTLARAFNENRHHPNTEADVTRLPTANRSRV